MAALMIQTLIHEANANKYVSNIDTDFVNECPVIIIPNGEVSIAHANRVATFSCNIGYILRGANTQTCHNNGTWSGGETQCGE